MTPDFVSGCKVVIDNRKIDDGASVGPRSHYLFGKMLPDVGDANTIAAMAAMSNTPLAEWGDEGISAYNFWWNLVDNDALGLYLVASVLDADDCGRRVRHCKHGLARED